MVTCRAFVHCKEAQKSLGKPGKRCDTLKVIFGRTLESASKRLGRTEWEVAKRSEYEGETSLDHVPVLIDGGMVL